MKIRIAQTRGHIGSNLVRCNRSKLAAAVCGLLIAWSSSAVTAAAAESLAGERAEAASELTDPYRLGRKQVETKLHPDRFDALAGSADPATAALGQLLVERKDLRAKIEADLARLQREQADAVKKMQRSLQGFLFRDVLGPERSFGERLRDAAGSAKAPVSDTLKVQKELFQLGLQELKQGQKVRAKIRELRAPLVATEGAEKDLFVAFRLNPKRHELAAMSIKYRGQQALHHVLVLVELDCKYDLEHAKQELDGLGGAMLYALGANLMQLPDKYFERDKARVDYENLDKGHYVYLDTWNPSSALEMDVQEALSLVKFTQSAKLTIVSDELTVVDHDVPLGAGKKKLVTELKTQFARQKKMAMSGRKRPQKPPQKPTTKAPPKRRK